MKIALHAAAWLITAVLIGCASLGLTEPKSFEDRLAYANGQVTALVRSTTNSARLGYISRDDAQYVATVAKESAAMLDAAEVAAQAGDAANAEQRLLMASNILTALETYLQSRGTP